MTFTATSFPQIASSVPATLGFTPQESIVILTFRDKRLGATLRLDLPVNGVANDDWLRTTAGYLTRANADALIVIVYTSTSIDDDTLPMEGFAHAVSRFLKGALDVEVYTAGVITDDYWADYMHGGGGPAVECAFSVLTATVAANNSAPDTTIPRGRSTDPLPAPRIMDEEERPAAWAAWNAAIEGSNDVPLETMIGWFADKQARDGMAVRALVGGDPTVSQYEDLLFGKIPGLLDKDRVMDALGLMGRMLAITEDDLYRAELLAVRGWLNWVIGRASIATDHLAAALAHVPEHRLAALMMEIIRRGTLSAVAADAKHWIKN